MRDPSLEDLVNEALATRATTTIGVVLAIAASSVAGVYSSRASETVTSHSLRLECLSGLSAGVLVAVAWLHLLDDAQERLEGLTEYPAANAAMLAGFLFMNGVQTLTMPCHHSPSSAGLPLLPTNSEPKTRAGVERLRVFHVLEASISVHSVLIGLGFGLGELGGQEQLVLGLALCVHQFLEGLTVGMLGTKSGLSRRGWRCTYLVFTLSLPIGVAAGVTVRHIYDGFDDNLTFRWCAGLLNALAAGTLTHIGVHMCSAHAEEPPPSPIPVPMPVPVPHERSMTPDSVTKIACADRPVPGLPPDPDCYSRHQALVAMVGESVDDTAMPGYLLGACEPPRDVLRILAAGFGATLMAVLAIWA